LRLLASHRLCSVGRARGRALNACRRTPLAIFLYLSQLPTTNRLLFYVLLHLCSLTRTQEKLNFKAGSADSSVRDADGSKKEIYIIS
jgi:hypothetical protein